MSRPAGLSDSESEEEFYFNDPSTTYSRPNQNVEGYNESENAENVWFDTDKNNSIDQNKLLNPTCNAEKTVYLSTDHENNSGKKSPSSLPKRRQASPLPFGHIRMAIIQGNLPIVESLIQKGISIDQTIKSGWTLLMVAASSGQDHIVEYLLGKGANPNLHKACFTPLMAAAASERSEDKIVSCVEQLIEYDANVDASETHGMTALMFAAKAGKAKVVEVLLKSGADVDKCDYKELTALFWAASAGRNEAVKVLLNSSADPKQIAMGQNVIEAALASGNKEMACLLEKHCRGTLDNKDWENLSDLEKNKIVYDSKQDEMCGFREVERILTTIGAEMAVPIFREHKISMTNLLHLTEKDLIHMGISQFGIRFDILTAIKSINIEEWKKSSLPDILNKKCLTLEDSIAMVRNMDAHIRYMNATFGFLRSAVESYPQLFTMDRKCSDALHLTDTCFSYLQNVNGLEAEIEDLRRFLNTECNNKEYTPAGLIGRNSNQRNWTSLSLTSVGIMAAITSLIYYFKPKLFTKMFIESIPRTELFIDLAK